MKVVEIVIRVEVDEAKVASLTAKRNRLGNHGPVVPENELVNAVVQAVQHNMLFSNVSTQLVQKYAEKIIGYKIETPSIHCTRCLDAGCGHCRVSVKDVGSLITGDGHEF